MDPDMIVIDGSIMEGGGIHSTYSDVVSSEFGIINNNIMNRTNFEKFHVFRSIIEQIIADKQHSRKTKHSGTQAPTLKGNRARSSN